MAGYVRPLALAVLLVAMSGVTRPGHLIPELAEPVSSTALVAPADPGPGPGPGPGHDGHSSGSAHPTGAGRPAGAAAAAHPAAAEPVHLKGHGKRHGKRHGRRHGRGRGRVYGGGVQRTGGVNSAGAPTMDSPPYQLSTGRHNVNAPAGNSAVDYSGVQQVSSVSIYTNTINGNCGSGARHCSINQNLQSAEGRGYNGR
ncbi:hypothetical protein [Microbispora triticiradicis]|uniref:Uncharacterized protein n=2 Tax=Microbispora TaxID=2005 RepID=A0ABY3LTC3_9ACTN|nr:MULTISPECIES: hypothetical protein [Microbispora]TLP65967.1 hypothetical protein FED44_00050 [Microbispora fusca]TYB53289.1 hypothetical protein FXF59_23830 [Microbispora tritici]